jgi:hypothetical protein
MLAGNVTFFTSNLSIAAISELYSERVAGRIKDMCGQNILTLNTGVIKFDQSKIDQMINLAKMDKFQKAQVKPAENLANFKIQAQTASFLDTDQTKKINAFKNFMIGLMRGVTSQDSKAFEIATRTAAKNSEIFKLAFPDADLIQLHTLYTRAI